MAVKPQNRNFTWKQIRFIDDYCTNGGNGTKAAESAGYKGNKNALGVMAKKLLSNAKIVIAIELKKAELAAKNEVTVESVLRNLREIRTMANAKADYSTAARCTELEGKWLAMFTDKQQVEDVTQVQERQRLTEEEAAALRRAANIRLMESTGKKVG
jgi:phage terminase small subunit